MKLKRITVVLFTSIVSSLSAMGVSYSNDFSSTDLSDFTFLGWETGNWGVHSGRLHSDETSTPGVHVPLSGGSPGVGLVNGFANYDYFKIEARISVDGAGGIVNGSGDFGHVGFVWGFNDFTDYSMTYLRPHSNHVTAWSKTGAATEYIAGVASTTNGVEHDLALEVDNGSKTLKLWYDSVLINTIVGPQFDEVNPHKSGGLGLITWGEDVTYDNLSISARNYGVPDSGPTVLLLVLGLFSLVGVRRKLG